MYGEHKKYTPVISVDISATRADFLTICMEFYNTVKR